MTGRLVHGGAQKPCVGVAKGKGSSGCPEESLTESPVPPSRVTPCLISRTDSAVESLGMDSD